MKLRSILRGRQPPFAPNVAILDDYDALHPRRPAWDRSLQSPPKLSNGHFLIDGAIFQLLCIDATASHALQRLLCFNADESPRQWVVKRVDAEAPAEVEVEADATHTSCSLPQASSGS